MCGIVGYQGDFGGRSLEAALDGIAHRGPDSHGVFLEMGRGVGLAHARLSIIDLSPLGHQPMADDSGQVQLVFNGEIYNFRELRSDLESRGHRFRGHSDTEVLLHCYLEFGDACLPRLNGIFAFAIWDGRAGRMLVARDALGVKPLYFADVETGFAFCSEIKGLLPLVPQARALDAVSIHRYLTYQWCPGDGTPLKSVRKLLPGEALEVQAGRIRRRWTWYQLPPFRGVHPDLDEAASVEGAASALRTAVQRQMVADVPVGAFLSGGLDSSAVVAFARELNPRIQCFTIEATGGQDHGETDDLPYARRVAAHLGVPLEYVRIDASRMAADLERMVWQLDEPLGDPAPLNVLYICQVARSQGIKVLLSGAGGDDLFSGYRRHRAIRAEAWWSWLPPAARRAIQAGTAGLDQRRPTTRRLAKLFRGAGLSGDERVASYFEWIGRAELSSLYSEEFRSSIVGQPASAPMAEFLAPLPGSVTPFQRMLALEQRFFLSDHNLPYTDKMSMAVGVEARVPFLDLDLVEFAARIPDHLKQRGRVGKWVLKRAMEPYLPRDVIYRPKTGFTAPIRRWMRGDLLPMVLDLLGSESVRRRGIFDARAVEALVRANADGRVDASHTLLAMLCLEIWCRAFVDRTPVPGSLNSPSPLP
jgi:asparagine synthase (glutamine-hydrolysing)